MDEPMVELRLYTIMVPARRTKIGQLEQGCNLGMKHGIVGPADGGIILPGIARHLSHPQITLRLCQIYLPCHPFISHARGFAYATLSDQRWLGTCGRDLPTSVGFAASSTVA